MAYSDQDQVMALWKLNITDLKISDVAVLNALAWHLNGKSGRCNPSLKTLAREVHANKTTVYRSIRKLKELGLVSSVSGRGVTRSGYELHLDQPEPSIQALSADSISDDDDWNPGEDSWGAESTVGEKPTHSGRRAYTSEGGEPIPLGGEATQSRRRGYETSNQSRRKSGNHQPSGESGTDDDDSDDTEIGSISPVRFVASVRELLGHPELTEKRRAAWMARAKLISAPMRELLLEKLKWGKAQKGYWWGIVMSSETADPMAMIQTKVDQIMEEKPKANKKVEKKLTYQRMEVELDGEQI